MTSLAPSPQPAPKARPKGGAWAMRDHPGLLWMITAVITAAVHPFVPDATWLMVHMVALGALTHSIMVWSTHFTVSLLKNHPDIDVRATQNRRLVLLHLGIIGVLVGVPTTWWWLTLAGAGAVVVAVVWHGWQLVRRLRGALPGRFRIVVHHYLASAAFLPVGATLGVLLARGYSEEMHARMTLAHSLVNVLGWVGITVAGTLITLWPTILRVRMDPAAEQRATQALPGLVAGLSLAVVGALAGWRWVLLVGVLGYLVALLWTGRSLLAPARAKPPMHFASWSVAAGAVWFLVGIAMIAWRVATAPDMTAMTVGYGRVAAVLIVGFGLQVLCGALSHLVPAVIGGGPKVVRVGIQAFDRMGMTRIVIINVPLALSLMPVPSGTRVVLTTLVLIGLAAFIPILLIAVKRVVVARREAATSTPHPRRDLELGRSEAARVLDPPFPRTQLMAGVTLVALALAAGPVLQPVLDGGSGAVAAPGTSVAPTGETTTVEVVAQEDMSFSPSSIEVPAGDRLVIELTNEDDGTVHDLYLDDETSTPRLAKGESATLDVGIVGDDREGWCTVSGHKAMGMTFDIAVIGGATAGDAPSQPGATDGSTDADAHSTPGETSGGDALALDPGEKWPEDHEAYDATLPPLGDETTHRVTLRVQDVEMEVAPGVTQTRWTFGDTAPGPVLHGRVGDTFVITLVNDGSIGHSIDFHAGALAPDRPMRTIAPGEELTYTFTAERAGIWMYHCSTMPLSTHIAKGMHGAVVIEPPDLPEVDRSYVLTASEIYGDTADGTPAATTFNGSAFQYDADQLTAKVGERVRFWVLDAGPNGPMSFHVIGGQFDTVWREGAYTVGGPDQVGGPSTGSQALGLLPGQGGFVELAFPEPGHYPFVNHVMSAGEKGAHGIVRVR
ncbi:multicopper oxidase domain-containing protein [Janibacter cremeus]|uniref:multicopper oxidase domain-containing protein n=1 Tax=Janibacter cremeus TaxID=1285192 RepID=UPI0023F9F86D|nr:multicopper oxidase domain-containing protein [Janibacter cremeus]WEV77130.1 multicopper oxidase domain-containing protein [Janibacter cremeus]